MSHVGLCGVERRSCISRIGFGGAAISGEGGGYGFGDISEVDAVNLLRAALDRGITLYDTAPVYGYGLSEDRIGRAFSQMRDRVFIVSKCGVSWRDNKRIFHSNDPALIGSMLDESLVRLKTDYIDLYMIHWPDSLVPVAETIEVLVKAQEKGKIRDYGLCNYSEQGIKDAVSFAHISALQNEYNAFKVGELDGIFHLCSKHKLEFMGYGTFDKGVLTGRVTKERELKQLFSVHDLRYWAPWWKKENRDLKYQRVKKFQSLLNAHGYTLLEFAIGFVLQNPLVSNALCGIRSVEQLESISKALEHLPSFEELMLIVKSV